MQEYEVYPGGVLKAGHGPNEVEVVKYYLDCDTDKTSDAILDGTYSLKGLKFNDGTVYIWIDTQWTSDHLISLLKTMASWIATYFQDTEKKRTIGSIGSSIQTAETIKKAYNAISRTGYHKFDVQHNITLSKIPWLTDKIYVRVHNGEVVTAWSE